MEVWFRVIAAVRTCKITATTVVALGNARVMYYGRQECVAAATATG